MSFFFFAVVVFWCFNEAETSMCARATWMNGLPSILYQWENYTKTLNTFHKLRKEQHFQTIISVVATHRNGKLHSMAKWYFSDVSIMITKWFTKSKKKATEKIEINQRHTKIQICESERRKNWMRQIKWYGARGPQKNNNRTHTAKTGKCVPTFELVSKLLKSKWCCD